MGTKYFQEVDQKADVLRKVGELYTSVEIGNKVYEGLNFQLQQFLYTNFISQKIVCDSTSISVLLKNYEDMEARDNSNSKFYKPMNAFVVVPEQKHIRNQNDNLHPNKKFRGNLDDDNSTSLPNLSGLSSIKGREPQPGAHSKP